MNTVHQPPVECRQVYSRGPYHCALVCTLLVVMKAPPTFSLVLGALLPCAVLHRAAVYQPYTHCLKVHSQGPHRCLHAHTLLVACKAPMVLSLLLHHVVALCCAAVLCAVGVHQPSLQRLPVHSQGPHRCLHGYTCSLLAKCLWYFLYYLITWLRCAALLCAAL